ncbi:MAG: hypothetical protein ACHQQS_15365, partial [Thermoanaerobaculales bacterium]
MLRGLACVHAAAAVLASAVAAAGQSLPSSKPWWPAAGNATDAVILRDGTEQKGALKSCVAGQCQLGAQFYPRDSIEWIGFAVGITRPPEIVNLDKDEAHLRDGTVHAGALVGVNASDVVLQDGQYPRGNVAWVHLVIGPPPTPQGGGPGTERTPAPTSPPAPTPP